MNLYEATVSGPADRLVLSLGSQELALSADFVQRHPALASAGQRKLVAGIRPEGLTVAASTDDPEAARERTISVRAETSVDDPEFSTIRRKLARWAVDNLSIIKDLKPPQPPGFNNRLSANWKLPLQIAQHAGGGWPEQARRCDLPLSNSI